MTGARRAAEAAPEGQAARPHPKASEAAASHIFVYFQVFSRKAAASLPLERTRDCGMPRVGFCRASPTTLKKQRYAVRLRDEGHKKTTNTNTNNENKKIQINRRNDYYCT